VLGLSQVRLMGSCLTRAWSLPEGAKHIGFGDYFLTAEGSVINNRTHQFIKARLAAGKWPIVGLHRNGSYVALNLATLVYETFSGPVPENHIVRPVDGDKSNCALSNLTVVPRRARDIGRRGRSAEEPTVPMGMNDETRALVDAIEEVVSHEMSITKASLYGTPRTMRKHLSRLHEMILELALVANDVRWGNWARREVSSDVVPDSDE